MPNPINDFSSRLDRWADTKPRQFAAFIIAFALLLLLLHYFVAMHFHQMSRTVLCASFVLLFAGIWILISGFAYRPETPAPLWWHIGIFCFAGVGACIGFYVIWKFT